MSGPIVELEGVTKSFRRREVLRGVRMRLVPGEVVGFVGPNGAGKSTCLRILVGLVARDGGTARVHGLDPANDSLAIRTRTTYLPGETSVYSQMTGGEFLSFALGFYARRHVDLEARMLHEFDLPLGQRVRTYSAGMKQKLALIATLVPDVDLYVLDEPDRALDATTRILLREHMRALQQRGKTILLSSHHLSELEALAQRLVFLLAGECIDEATVAAAREQLRREVRVRLTAGATLPDGVAHVQQEPDGTLRVRTTGEPLAWVKQLDPARVQALELGALHLDDLYQALTEGRVA